MPLYVGDNDSFLTTNRQDNLTSVYFNEGSNFYGILLGRDTIDMLIESIGIPDSIDYFVGGDGGFDKETYSIGYSMDGCRDVYVALDENRIIIGIRIL